MLADPKAIRMAHQIQLEQLYSKNQLIPRIRREFEHCEGFDFTAYMEKNKIPIPFGFDVLTQMALHKRTSLPTLVGILRHHFDDSQLTADMILRAAEADLVDWSPTLRMFVVRFTLSADVQEELDKFQFPLPMVVEPMTLTRNTDTGYLMTGGSVILKKNHHEDDICLEHINRVNKIPMSVNLDTATMVKNQWRNLDKQKSGETKEHFEKRKRAFEKFDRSAHEIIQIVIEQGNRFYFTHKVDKRGRTYCQGYHLTTQGNPWCKAIIELADKEYVE